MVYRGESAIPGIAHNNKLVPDDTVPESELPEIECKEGEACKCPYCGNRFRTRFGSNKRQSADTEPIFVEQLHCTRCGHSWDKRTTEPKKCPRCGSYKWKEPANKMTCSICHHEWFSSTAEGPRRCPSCGSYDWHLLNNPEEVAFRPDPQENTLKRWICVKYEAGKSIIEIASDLKLPVMKVANLIIEYYNLTEFPRL